MARWRADQGAALGPVGRLGRWCRRNARLAALVAAVFGLLVLLAAVSSLAALRIAREQRQTLKEQKAARDHYSLALETLNSLVLDVNQKLGNRPGTLQLKRDILETARAGLEKIARSNEAEGTIDRGAVVAYDQLGDLFSTWAGPRRRSAPTRRSRDLAAALAAADPGSIQFRATWPWRTTSSATWRGSTTTSRPPRPRSAAPSRSARR